MMTQAELELQKKYDDLVCVVRDYVYARNELRPTDEHKQYRLLAEAVGMPHVSQTRKELRDRIVKGKS